MTEKFKKKKKKKKRNGFGKFNYSLASLLLLLLLFIIIHHSALYYFIFKNVGLKSYSNYHTEYVLYKYINTQGT